MWQRDHAGEEFLARDQTLANRCFQHLPAQIRPADQAKPVGCGRAAGSGGLHVLAEAAVEFGNPARLVGWGREAGFEAVARQRVGLG